MSAPGYFMAGQDGDPSQMTPQQRMAMAMMNQSYNPQQQNAGIANAGSSLAGALTMKNLAQQNSPESQVVQQRYGMTPQQANGVLNPGMFSGLFNMNGGGQ